MPDLQIYLLDQAMRLVPVGVPGEIYVGGEGLARGYLNRCELTAERFVPNPWSEKPGARLYRAGDLARWMPGGDLEYLGRIDRQVKIRGFRIELGDIEATLAGHEAVQEAVVIVREETNKRLVAYVVAAQGQAAVVNSNNLRSFMKERLPDYMVPSAFVLMDALPLTPNGKLDHKALPTPEASGLDSKLSFVAPQSDAEQTLARIWQQVLGLELVGIHDNFFELGGDSILSIQIISRARQAGLHLSARLLFQHQTIAELAPLARADSDAPSAHSATQGLVSGAVPLTPIQRWFFSQQLAVPQHWNQSLLMTSRERLDPVLLRTVIEQVRRHHDALRMRYRQVERGEWEQQNMGEEGCAGEVLVVVDVSGIREGERQRVVMEKVGGEVQARLDLESGEVWRVVVFEGGEEARQRVLMVAHHLVMDAVSWRILLEDVERGYRQAKGGEEIGLGEKTSSYRQWAEELEKYAESEEVEQQVEYWMRRWEKAGGAGRLPVDYPLEASVEQVGEADNGDAENGGGENRRGENGGGDEQGLRAKNLVRDEQVVSVELGEEQTRALLREVGEAYRAQVEEVLLSAVLEACRRWSGEAIQVIEMEGHGREEISANVDVTRTVGWFTTKYPVVVELSERGDVVETLKRVKEEMRGVPKRGIGYGLIRYMSRRREEREGLGRGEVWEMSFNYLGQLDGARAEMKQFEVERRSAGLERAGENGRNQLMNVRGYVMEGRLRVEWITSGRRYKEETIRRVGEECMAVMKEIIERSGTADSFTPSDFPLANISQEELEKLLLKIS
jgi:non-ribosomal peptide synthase protein (TIGR01720 family)